MTENPDIAKGFVKQNKDKITEFWKKLTLELNSAGPPNKSEFEWKKVWTDQKRYVRKKAAGNKMYERGTGGGPNKTQKFSPTEEAIFQLVGMKEAVEGVEKSNSYGLPPSEKKRKADIDYEIAVEDEEEVEEAGLQIDAEPCNNVHQPTSPAAPKKTGKQPTKELIAEELEAQKELCAKVGEAISIMIDHNKEIQSSARRVYRSLDRLNDQKKEQLEEQKRHNGEMEKFRKAEIESLIEKNRRVMELEELKVNILKEK